MHPEPVTVSPNQTVVPVVNSPLTPVGEAILAIVVSVSSVAVGFGLIDNDHAQIIVSAAGPLIGAVWLIASSINRKSRAEVKAAALVSGQAVPVLEERA